MTQADDFATLTAGLRALEVLAHNAPLDLRAFARLSGLGATQAGALIAVFEVYGFAERVSRDMLYVPTGLTLRLVAVGRTADAQWLH